MSQGDYYNERGRYGSQPADDYDDDDDPRYQQNVYDRRPEVTHPGRRQEEPQPRVYGRRYDPNLNPAAEDKGQGNAPDQVYEQPRANERGDSGRNSDAYSNAAYETNEEWAPPRVYGRRNDPRKYDDEPEYQANPEPVGPRYGPYGGENQNYDSHPKATQDVDYDDRVDAGFASPRGRHLPADNMYEDEYHHPPSDTQRDYSFEKSLPRSPGMDDLALEAANGPPLPPRTAASVTQSNAPVETQPSGKWMCPTWLYRPAWVLGMTQVVLGVFLLIFGCVDASFSHVKNALTAGQGIWGGLIIGCAGALMICVALKKKQIFAYVSIGLTGGGLVCDIIIFGICGKAVSDFKAFELTVKSNANGVQGINLASYNFDQYYAIYSLLIFCAYTHVFVGIVALVFLAVAVLRPQEQTSFISEYLNSESSSWGYPKMLYKPARITAVCQIVLGFLIFVFGCVEVALQSQWPTPPGFTAAEGVWGGPIIIAAGILTIVAAKLKTKFFVVVVIAVTAITVIIDILIFGICGYIVDELNRPTIGIAYQSVYPRPNFTLWTAIYDVLIILAFIHIIVAIVVIVIHVLVFVPTKYLPQPKKKAPSHTQARIVSQYQQNNRSVPMGDVRRSAEDEPRRLEFFDSRDVHVREAPPYRDAPPRYDDLPPSPDPYNTAVGYNLSFAPVEGERPPHRDGNPDHQRGAYDNKSYSRSYDDERPRHPSENEPSPYVRGAQPYSERDCSPREPHYSSREPSSTAVQAPPSTRKPHLRDESPQRPSGRELHPTSYEASQPHHRDESPRQPSGREHHPTSHEASQSHRDLSPQPLRPSGRDPHQTSYAAREPSDSAHHRHPGHQRPQLHNEVENGEYMHSPSPRGRDEQPKTRSQHPNEYGQYQNDRAHSHSDRGQGGGRGNDYEIDSRSPRYSDDRAQHSSDYGASQQRGGGHSGGRGEYQQHNARQPYDDQDHSYHEENQPHFGRSSGI